MNPSLSVRAHNSHGFTLVELLIAIGVVVVLAALAFSQFTQLRERGLQSQCIALQKKMAYAASLYANDWGYYPSSVVGQSLWPQTLTDYMGVPNTAENRGAIYTCPKRGASGEKEFIVHNMWMGYSENEKNADARRYIRLRPGMIPEPSRTSLFTCGYNRQPNNSSMRHYYYRTGRASGADSVNRSKFGGGAIWVFVDGHAEWLSEAQAAERAGSSGQGVPFIKPFN